MSNNMKFVNVDILAAMEQIVNIHTEHYQSDFFEVDVPMLREASEKKERQDRTFLWLCRTHGTWLLNERNTFIRTTFEYNTFTFYAENHINGILAYAVEITGCDGDKVLGNLYALDYEQYVSHIHVAALEPSTLVLNYKRGTRYVHDDMRFVAGPDAELGALVSHAYLPESQADWDYMLYLEQKSRQRFVKGNFAPYLAAI